MSQKLCKPLALAIGAALVGSAGAASASPAFALVDIGAGYMVAAGGEGKCGEGKCGMDMMDTNKDGSVSRHEHAAHANAMFTAADANKDGKVTQAEMDARHKGMEGKCGEGKCGHAKGEHGDHEKGKEGSCGHDKGKEGSCGHDKGKDGADKGMEGSCGHDKGKEGSCGGSA